MYLSKPDLPRLRQLLSSCIHFPENVTISFIVTSAVSLHHTALFYSSADVCLSWFHFLTTVNLIMLDNGHASVSVACNTHFLKLSLQHCLLLSLMDLLRKASWSRVLSGCNGQDLKGNRYEHFSPLPKRLYVQRDLGGRGKLQLGVTSCYNDHVGCTLWTMMSCLYRVMKHKGKVFDWSTAIWWGLEGA